MKTEKQREDDFRRDFSALLKKHGAQIQITDDGKTCMQSGACRILMMCQFSDDDNLIAEHAEFEI